MNQATQLQAALGLIENTDRYCDDMLKRAFMGKVVGKALPAIGRGISKAFSGIAGKAAPTLESAGARAMPSMAQGATQVASSVAAPAAQVAGASERVLGATGRVVGNKPWTPVSSQGGFSVRKLWNKGLEAANLKPTYSQMLNARRGMQVSTQASRAAGGAGADVAEQYAAKGMAGGYSPANKTLTMVDNLGGAGGRSTMRHELMHGYQHALGPQSNNPLWRASGTTFQSGQNTAGNSAIAELHARMGQYRSTGRALGDLGSKGTTQYYTNYFSPYYGQQAATKAYGGVRTANQVYQGGKIAVPGVAGVGALSYVGGAPGAAQQGAAGAMV